MFRDTLGNCLLTVDLPVTFPCLCNFPYFEPMFNSSIVVQARILLIIVFSCIARYLCCVFCLQSFVIVVLL